MEPIADAQSEDVADDDARRGSASDLTPNEETATVAALSNRPPSSTSHEPNFEALFNSSPACYLVLDPTLTILAASDAYLIATKTVRAEILGRDLFDVFPTNPEEEEATGEGNVRASLMRVLHLGVADTMAVQKYDIPVPEADGGGFEVKYWSVVNSPVIASDGNVEYIINRVEEVTEFVRLTQLGAERQQSALELGERTARMEADIVLRSQELQEANRALRLVVDATNDAFITTSRSGHITGWNKTAEALFEWPAAAAAGCELSQVVGELKVALDEVLHGRQIDQAETAVLTRGGHRRFISVNARPILDDGGVVRGAIVAVRDVTDRQNAHEALRVRERQLAAAQQIARMGSWEWDVVNDVVSWSEELYRIFNRQRSQFQPTYGGFLSCVDSGDRLRVDAAVQEAFRTGEPFEFDHHTRDGDGRVREIRGRGEVVLAADGTVARMTGIAQDVTESNRNAAALAESEERFRSLAASAPVGVFQSDIAGRFTYTNAR